MQSRLDDAQTAAGSVNAEHGRAVVRGPDRAVAYREAGEGPPVLLIHGALTNLDEIWLALAEPLVAAGFRVIAFDRPGHGLSSRRRLVDASPWRQAEVLHAAAEALGVGSAVVVGHSFGGAVALAYAMRFPEATTGAVALAPIAWPEPRLELALFGWRAPPLAGDLAAGGAAATLDPLVLPPLWRAMFLPQAMPQRFRDGFSFDLAGASGSTQADGEDAVAVVTELWRSVAAYPRCGTPVRLLTGDRDAVINPLLHARRLADVLTNAQLETLPGLGHMLHHFAPDAVVRAVRALHGA